MKILGLLLLVICFFASLLIGPVSFHSLLPTTETENLVFWHLRLPRTLTAIFVGGSLGFAGALLQSLLRNPLAEPYTLGLSGAASFGAVIAIVLGLQPLHFFMPLFAMTAALLTGGLVIAVAFQKSVSVSKNLILAGVMISLFFGSLVILLMNLLRPEELQVFMFWMMGQIGTERDQNWWHIGLLLGLSAVWSLGRFKLLDRLLINHEVSATLGTPLLRIRTEIILVVSLLVAVSVSVSGLIGFVGLLAPHLARYLLKTHRHQVYLGASLVSGSVLLLFSDILTRVLGGEREIPTGGLTALIGAPLLIYFLFRRERFYEG